MLKSFEPASSSPVVARSPAPVMVAQGLPRAGRLDFQGVQGKNGAAADRPACIEQRICRRARRRGKRRGCGGPDAIGDVVGRKTVAIDRRPPHARVGRSCFTIAQ